MPEEKNRIITATVLVIDDEAPLRRLLRVALEAAGYEVFDADSGRTGLAELAFRRPDLVVLDLGLPDMEGAEVLRRLREWSRVPVLVLSVRQDVQEKVAALDLGADDYLTKPFHPAELAARLRALRRHSPQEPEAAEVVRGPLRVDFAARQVFRDGQEVRLTATEYALFCVLVRNEGRVVTHRQLLRDVWGPKAEEQSQYLRVYMNHLRQKLEPVPGQPRLLRNEPGIGYRFVPAGEKDA